ncbi:MAG: hypothetical protein JKY42_07850 [Flavobacteriales bacterium]|nr:hypothetical protein [Flavobacteriales bacterium]
MHNKTRILFILIFLLLILSGDTFGQCAMCKAVAESGGEKQAEGLNNGIIFLMIVPYLVMGILALVIRKQSK